MATKLSIQSINGWKRDSPKMLSFVTNRKRNVCVRGEPRLIHSTTSALSASSAVEPSGGSAHNHSKLWSLERYLSIGLLAVIPTSFLVSAPPLDYLLALSLVTHVHWGIEAIVVDYIRPSVFGKVIPKLALAYIYVLSILALSGLFYFNYTDVGLSNAIRMIAKI